MPAAGAALAFRIPRRVRACAAPLALSLIVVCLFWKLTLTRQYTWLNSVDAAHQVLPWLDFQAREFHRGNFPLWDPHLWAGQSLIGQVQPGSAYPPNWLLFLMPLKDGHINPGVLEWYWVLIHVLGALNCYWLCRDLERSRMASVLAGAGFALGGFVGRIEWPQHLNSAIWAPLVLMFTFRSWRGTRPWADAALSGAFLGLSFLGGHFQVPVFLTAAVGLLWVVFLLGRPKPWRTWAVAPLVAGLMCLLTGAFQILPAMEYGRSAVRWMGVANMEPLTWDQPVPYSVHTEFALPPASLAGAVIPGLASSSGIYIGLVLAVGAAIGLVAAWNRREARMAALVSVVGVALALGPYSVFHGLAYAAFPMMEKARNPGMAVALIGLGGAVLAGFGFDAITGGLAELAAFAKATRRMLVAFAALLAGFLAVVDLADLKLAQDIRFGVPVISGLALAALVWVAAAGRLSRLAAGGWLLLILLFELGNSAGYYLPSRAGMPYLARYEEQADLGHYLQSLPGLPRVDIDEEDVPYNFGDWYGIDQFGGYVASIPEVTFRLQGDPKVRALAGVAYRVSRKTPAPGYPEEVFQGRSGIRIFRNPDALPRVWTVHSVREFSGRVADIPPALAAPGFDPRRDVLLAKPVPRLKQCAGDQILSVNRTPDTFSVDVEMKCGGILVVAEPASSGWQARVDSAPVEIRPAYGFLRSIEVAAGRHRVSMRYRPWTAVWGAWLSMAGAALAVFASVRSRTLIR